ncbi:hypothetical protein C6N75_27285, partial [Streptomyces solincola]
VLASRPAPDATWPGDTACLSPDARTPLSHARLLDRLDAVQSRLATGPEDTWALAPSLLHHAWLPWAALLSGARLTVADDPALLPGHRPTVLACPAAFLGSLSDQRLPALRRILRTGPAGSRVDTAAFAPHAEVLTEDALVGTAR